MREEDGKDRDLFLIFSLQESRGWLYWRKKHLMSVLLGMREFLVVELITCQGWEGKNNNTLFGRLLVALHQEKKVRKSRHVFVVTGRQPLCFVISLISWWRQNQLPASSAIPFPCLDASLMLVMFLWRRKRQTHDSGVVAWLHSLFTLFSSLFSSPFSSPIHSITGANVSFVSLSFFLILFSCLVKRDLMSWLYLVIASLFVCNSHCLINGFPFFL